MESRIQAAEAFWRDEESPEIQSQQIEALVMLARRLNFRPKSLQSLPADRKAKHLAQVRDVSEGIATRALIAYHFASKRALMSAFLDALGVAHENGLISEEHVDPFSRESLEAAIAAVSPSFPKADLELYLRTLSALDTETWGNLSGLLPAKS